MGILTFMYFWGGDICFPYKFLEDQKLKHERSCELWREKKFWFVRSYPRCPILPPFYRVQWIRIRNPDQDSNEWRQMRPGKECTTLCQKSWCFICGVWSYSLSLETHRYAYALKLFTVCTVASSVIRIRNTGLQARYLVPGTQCCGSDRIRKRIRILLFSSVTFNLQDVKKKVFCLLPYFLKVHLYRFSKIKSQKKSQVTKQKESMFFLLFFLDDRRIWIRKVQKHMDPTDPDPQHCGYQVPRNHEGKQLICAYRRTVWRGWPAAWPARASCWWCGDRRWCPPPPAGRSGSPASAYAASHRGRTCNRTRVVDPHWYNADPNPAFS